MKTQTLARFEVGGIYCCGIFWDDKPYDERRTVKIERRSDYYIWVDGYRYKLRKAKDTEYIECPAGDYFTHIICAKFPVEE